MTLKEKAQQCIEAGPPELKGIAGTIHEQIKDIPECHVCRGDLDVLCHCFYGLAHEEIKKEPIGLLELASQIAECDIEVTEPSV